MKEPVATEAVAAVAGGELLVLLKHGVDEGALRARLAHSVGQTAWRLQPCEAQHWQEAAAATESLPAGQEVVWFGALPETLPTFWLERLREAAGSQPGVWTCLGSGMALDLALSGEADALTTDQLCAVLGQRRWWPLPLSSRPQMVWMRAGRVAADDTLRCIERLYIPCGETCAETPAALDPSAELRLRWPATPPQGLRGVPGADARPVLLHVLHDWGGGIERFALDLAEADPERVHLALRARGHWRNRRYGEHLELCLLPQNLVLRRWPLTPAIGSVASHHPGYRRLLGDIVAEHGVAGVIVSSLIGHSLDALRLDLPTVQVAHDYFPLWPELHCDFGDPEQRFDAEARRQCVQTLAGDSPFAERDPAFWQGLFDEQVRLLASPALQLAAPSRSVVENLRRMAPQLAHKDIAVLPHGLRAWPEPVPRCAPDFSQSPLRLLVLGRIDGGKGLELLRGALPELTRHVELYLLGCGKAGEALFGVSGVHIELNYPNDELPARIARIRPHAALLLSTVAESFSYTLSELWSLGVVPVATRTGAFAERIEDGRNGLLFAPDARALVRMVRQIAQEPQRLRALHEQLHQLPMRSSKQMAADYAALLPLDARQGWPAVGVDAAAALSVERTAESLRLRRQTEEQSRQLRSQQTELERRAAWGFALDRQLQQRTQWARALERELQDSREHHATLQQQASEVEAQTRQQLGLLEGALAESEQRRRQLRDRARERLREERRLVRSLAERLADIADEVRRSAAEQARRDGEFTLQLQQLMEQRDDVQRQLQQSEAQRQEILASSSWRLTAPMRVSMRGLRALLPGLSFRLLRLRSLLLRFESSLRSRGVRGTLQRLRQEWRKPVPAAPALEAPTPKADFEALTLPRAEQPLVSIIIPVYGKLEYTITCLKSLVAARESVPYEVVVVDDCSPDDSAEALQRVDGITLLRNAENLGFIGACNAGAAASRGDYLCFLNNDTAVQQDWLSALMRTFEQFPDCGLAGAKLIYPDGRLQEAGGIIFNDGAGWNYGRFDDPADPRYDYPREADYCSGAAIVLSRELFEEFGGFDKHYAPAYYEDTDLAFKVRARGLRVYYQPAARVIHYEGITSGTDTSSGAKRYQVVNQQKFLERWAKELSEQPDHDGSKVGLACEHRVAGRILLIDATTPTPDQDSGSVRMMNLLRLLVAEHWKVVFFADNRAYVEGYTEAVKALGVEVQHHPWLTDAVEFFRNRGAEFDAVMVCRHYIASNYIGLARKFCPDARFIFDTVDLHFLREERAAAVADDEGMRRQAAATREQELELIRNSDVTVVVSPVEQQLLAEIVPGARVDVLSNIHEVAGRRREYAERRDIFFVGGFQHVPNVDAVLWFVKEVWPEIRRQLPELRFHVVGSKMPLEIKGLGEVPGVVIEGFVDKLEPFLDGCRLAVAPLRYGAGVKGKVNSSMAHGQPVVMSNIAAEGMFLEHGVHGLIADTPQAFAEQVVRLYQDEALWQSISEAGLRNVADNFSMEAAKRALQRLLVQ